MRRLWQSPAYLAFSLLTMSLAIGATTAGYAALRSVLFAAPDGLTNPRLVNLYQKDPRQGGSIRSLSFGVSEYEAIRASATAFDHLVGHSPFRHSVTLPSGVELLWGELASGNYFEAFELQPVVGRLIQSTDDHHSAPLVAVISYGLWQKAFGAAPTVVGATIRLNGSLYDVIGVAPRGFRGTFNPEVLATAVWIPLAQADRLSAPGQRFSLTSTGTGDRWLLAKARLRPDTGVREAATQLATIAARLDAHEPVIDTRRPGNSVQPRRWKMIPTADIRLHGQERFFSPILGSAMGALVLVVLIACLNVANLTTARMKSRRQELLVRVALGATQGRLLREQLTETFAVSVAACALGLVVAFIGMRLMAREIVIGSGLAFSINPVFDPSVLLVAGLSSAIAFVCFGFFPVLAVLRKSSSQTIIRGVDDAVSLRWEGRKRLIAIQVSASVVLLAAAAICGIRIQHEFRRTGGIDLHRLALLQAGIPSADLSPNEIASVVAPVRHALAGRSNIEAFAVASGLPPLTETQSAEIIDNDGRQGPPSRLHARLVAATPDLFTTIGLRTDYGQTFQLGDMSGSEALAVVSRRLANRLATTGNAVGHYITYRPGRLIGEELPPLESARITGVVEDISDDNDPREMVLYVPLAQKPQRSLTLIARSGDPEAAAGTLFAAFRAVRPDLPISMVGTADMFAGAQMMLARLGSWLMSFLGLTAFILALVGLYSVLTLLVTARRREVGIRLALGASEHQIVGLIMRDGLSPVVVGLALGLVIAVVGWSTASRMLLLTDSTQLRMLVLSILGLVMLGVAYVSCRIPARRAARVDPAITLRHL